MKHTSLRVLALLLAAVLCLALCPAMAENEKGPLWLSDEKIELTLWYDFTQAQLGNMADPNEADVFIWLEEQTNVHINWILPVAGAEKQSFNVLFASDRMPDIIRTRNKYQYVDGAEAAVVDGYYLRLNELLPENAPKYMAYLDAHPQFKKEVATDSGLMWGMYFFYMDEGKACNYGPCIRKDFLDKLNLEMPVTYDDWHTVLTAFKNELGIESPLYINNKASSVHDEWMSGFGVTQDFYQEDGVVKYGPVGEGYREYIETLAKWYDEGLIYKDFNLGNTNPDGAPDDYLIMNDKIGAWTDFASQCGRAFYPTRGATNQEFNLIGTKFPAKNAGDTTHLRFADTFVNEYAWAITSDCEYPEIAIKWLDIFYDPELFDSFNYGFRENESFVVNEDGSKSWGDLINKNPDGLTVQQARVKYTMLNCPVEKYSRVMGAWSQDQLDSQKRWLEGKDDWCLSDKLSPSAEESTEISAIMTDIRTFVYEESAKMVAGTSTYTFDTFRDKILSMDLDKALTIYQKVLDRYNAR